MCKRLFDIIVSLLGIIILSPVLLVCALLVWMSMGQPVFFRQIRPGLKGRPFRLIKFRTMTNKRGKDGNLLPDEKRMTRAGRFLRSSSLDELPELFNVLKGEMSLVGPRPLLMEYIPLYNDFQARRHDVRPGITGWAQINGRNLVGWDERFKLDVWYVENRSFWLDLKILFMTVITVFKAEGISSGSAATMEKFKGDDHVNKGVL